MKFEKGSEYAREQGRKGGKSRKHCKTIRKILATVSHLKVTDESIVSDIRMAGYEGDITIDVAIAYKTLIKSMTGDVRAIKLYYDFVRIARVDDDNERIQEEKQAELKTVIYLPDNGRDATENVIAEKSIEV